MAAMATTPEGSHMRATMRSQPDELRRIAADADPARRCAERLAGRPLTLIGVGSSLHAAEAGAWFLAEAGIEAPAWPAADAAGYGRPAFGPGDGVVLISHGMGTGATATVRERALEAGAEVVAISGVGAGGELETVPDETSYAHTASYTGSLLRLAQLAVGLGAPLGELAAVGDAVERVLELPAPLVDPPERLLELIGAGPNAVTAREGALKVREAAYVATEGHSAEQFFHGPSVAVDRRDALVVLDGGGPLAQRLEGIASTVAVGGARIERFSARGLGEALSIFELTAVVQRIALDLAETLGTDPDRFRYDQDPARERAFESLGF